MTAGCRELRALLGLPPPDGRRGDALAEDGLSPRQREGLREDTAVGDEQPEGRQAREEAADGDGGTLREVETRPQDGGTAGVASRSKQPDAKDEADGRRREPAYDWAVPPAEKTVPYHVAPGSPLYRTSHLVLFEQAPAMQYDMEHVKSLPLAWLWLSLETHALADPLR
ncbi:uncharacterized protein LOC119093148 [Pollicipes pollicipes]|uniref:uncharacterized protein LOC119093148 n=1 Tax=Pollicipes pollicipes TaxID=41117 RepID=UPI001885578C|nr:uncharacterized protein LOC119093148 [Pollicipes pollicipes]